MFKLTYNNLRLMLFFSFRSSFKLLTSGVDSQFETKYPWNRRYYTNWSLDIARDNHFRNVDFLSKAYFVNGSGYFRWYSFLFADSQKFIKNNKCKWLAFFIFIINLEYLLLTLLIMFL